MQRFVGQPRTVKCSSTIILLLYCTVLWRRRVLHLSSSPSQLSIWPAAGQSWKRPPVTDLRTAPTGKLGIATKRPQRWAALKLSQQNFRTVVESGACFPRKTQSPLRGALKTNCCGPDHSQRGAEGPLFRRHGVYPRGGKTPLLFSSYRGQNRISKPPALQFQDMPFCSINRGAARAEPVASNLIIASQLRRYTYTQCIQYILYTIGDAVASRKQKRFFLHTLTQYIHHLASDAVKKKKKYVQIVSQMRVSCRAGRTLHPCPTLLILIL